MENEEGNGMSGLEPPLAMLAELTHRCPLQCPYCSNPIALSPRSGELDTAEWADILSQAAALGVLQVHLSGGEPTARKDLAAIISAAKNAGIYTNLITAGVLLTRPRLEEYRAAGLDHVQISIQDSEPENANRIGNYACGHARKLEAAGLVRALHLPLTINAVVHRQNLDHLPQIIALAHALGAQRLEIANVQYYGWALKNRAVLMPTREQVERATAVAAAAVEQYRGRMVIDYVVPDYYARRPKRCMDGWGSRYFAVSPRGRVLPCHAAESITGMEFSSLREHTLEWIWQNDPAFNRFRGTDWMPEPCRSCSFKEKDLGGCRCQAFALTGDAAATDPVCEFSPRHQEVAALVAADTVPGRPRYIYRH
ncbi:MAG TPA: pyrroloquinoline quinone biosynthesis protein PqqE [Gammaproteobacteria bacterium]|nr:pyrroloquinoline quinone biosynthesis protein PqqE [Gammaproteobacteria bacterium]